MTNDELIEALTQEGRSITSASQGEEALGPLKHLPGVWSNTPNLPGRGWNMIALPFAGGNLGYRLLLNQYNETLTFSTVDKGVPNRGIPDGAGGPEADQLVAAIDYEQKIEQIDAADSPISGQAGGANLAIHHEPGLFLHMINKQTQELDIARLATIPHGNSVLALGHSNSIDGAPVIPEADGLPIGVHQSLDSGYLRPYKQFNDEPFKNLFNPVRPNDLLNHANQGVDIVRTTELKLDTKIASGGISNIPFVVRQADATEMTSTFWIQELAELDDKGNPRLRLQYTQTVFLDFFPRTDGVPGAIRWPHISINTLEKIA